MTIAQFRACNTLWRSRWMRPRTRPLQRHFSTSHALQAKQVRIVEVGPRDGLQNEKTSIPTETKIELVRRLASTGLRTIEAGSFVSPKWVPQMANSSSILEHLLGADSNASSTPVTYQWLLPNMKGLGNFLDAFNAFSHSQNTATATDTGPALNTSAQNPNEMPSSTSAAEAMSRERGPNQISQAEKGPAINKSSQSPNDMPSSSSGVDATPEQRQDSSAAPAPRTHEISIFTAATETFTRKNTNCSIAESLERFRQIVTTAREHHFDVRAYVSVALGCPYEGPEVPPHRVAEIATALLEMGVDEVSVADTTGMGTPKRTAELLKTLHAAGIQNQDLALHFHDTYGQALVNTMVGLEHGVATFDAAVGGLGGCPFSPGATGNVATEDLVHMFHGLGADTGVDLHEVAQIGDWISKELGRTNESRAGKATLAKARL